MATGNKRSQSRCESPIDDVAMETDGILPPGGADVFPQGGGTGPSIDGACRTPVEGAVGAAVNDTTDGVVGKDLGVTPEELEGALGEQLATYRSNNGDVGESGEAVVDHMSYPNGAPEEQAGAPVGIRGAQPVRSSARILKRPRRDLSPPSSPPKKPLPKDQKEKKSRTPKVGRTTKRHEVWSQEDKDVFFEALAEHGKNFEAIRTHVERKHLSSKADPGLVKTKEQVRHLYYRTWAKISKYIEQKDGISKHAIELYSLINYGELRKKVGPGLDERTGTKLNELVHKGTAGLRFNKKYHRLKTPTCPALKNLNKARLEEQEVESKDDPTGSTKIPDRLTLELRPHSNEAWAQVQNISQNPRVRIHVKPEQRLAGVISLLSNKWKSVRLRTKEYMKESEEPVVELRLLPPADSEICPYDVTATPSNHSAANLLNIDNYRRSVKNGKIYDDKKVLRPAKKRPKDDAASPEVEPEMGSAVHDGIGFATDENAQLPDDDVIGAKFDGPVGFTGAVNAASLNLNLGGTSENKPGESGATQSVEAELNTGSEEPGSDAMLPSHDAPPHHVTSRDDEEPIITLNSEASDEKIPSTAGQADGSAEDGQTEEVKEEKNEASEGRKEGVVRRIKEGWRIKTAENITIGEIYLLLGAPEKLMLEYEWVDIKTSAQGVYEFSTKLTNILRRLIHLAATEFTDYSKNKHNPLAGAKSPPRCKCRCSQSNTPPSVKGRSPRGVAALNSPSTPKGGRAAGGAILQQEVEVPACTALSQTQVVTDDAVTIATSVPTQQIQLQQVVTGATFVTKDSIPRTAPIPSSSVTEPTTLTVNGNLGDGVFRVPTAAAPIRSTFTNRAPLTAQPIRSTLTNRAPIIVQNGMAAQQLENVFMPRRRQRMVRTRKPLIVQRRLVPKAEIPTRQIMALTMVPNSTHQVQTGSFLPVQLVQDERDEFEDDLKEMTSDCGVESGAPYCPFVQSGAVKPPGGATVMGNGLQTLQLQPGGVLTPIISQSGAFIPVSVSTVTNTTTASSVQTKVTESSRAVTPTSLQSTTPSSTGLDTSPLPMATSSPLRCSQETQMTLTQVAGVIPATMTSTTTTVTSEVSFTSDGAVHTSPTNMSFMDMTPSDDSPHKLMDLSLCNSDSSFSVSGFLENANTGSEDPNLQSALSCEAAAGSSNLQTALGIETSAGSNSLQTPLGIETCAGASVLTASVSPTKLVRPLGVENQWLNGEEFSLSQFLESPLKRPAETTGGSTVSLSYSESSRDSLVTRLDVDSALQCMMNENSMDYVAKFADLAAQITNSDQQNNS